MRSSTRGNGSPLAWYHALETTIHEGRLPFLAYFTIDPAENPTVRPRETGEAPAALEPLDGEEGLWVGRAPALAPHRLDAGS
ncbi:MAG: hypothetical protein IT384_32950 [Deltaproteobacteria bacterium]|nr:hypothetical protein [Deltaproteobacteria bacterium]